MRTQTNIGARQYERLRALATSQGRPMSWYIWRGLTRHVLPLYALQDDAASEPVKGDTVKITILLPDEAAADLETFCEGTGRTKAWAIRTALEEYVFPTYEAADLGVARG